VTGGDSSPGKSSLLDFVLGRRLANREQRARKIGPLEAVPALGLDALASSSYGPEAALTVLMPLGAASLAVIGHVLAPVVLLLLLLAASYWQTIAAYPNNGGAYVVARETMGRNPSLLAAAALMVDYVLNVAVAISAGVAALISALPTLHSYTLPLCLAVLALVTLVNLRGTRESGRLFAVPTYLFVVSFFAILAVGCFRTFTSGGQPHAIVAPPPLQPGMEMAGFFLLLRAFSSGCTAMTGVEAVNNSMDAFAEPRVRKARITLLAIALILGTLLTGIAYLARAYRIAAMDQSQPGYQSVLSQLAHAVAGAGAAYYIAMAALLSVLILSANTSFVGFPRLCQMIAADGFLPKSFAIAGRRLVFTVGILYLTVLSGTLLLLSAGITDYLIPLFAIGAFLTFTISQSGMVMHWLRQERRRYGKLLINATGALVTAVALVVIVVTKFAEGAWLTLIAIPATILLLARIRRYYDAVARDVRDPAPLQLDDARPPVIVVITQSWNRLTDKALRFALTLSQDITAVHFTQLAGPSGDEEEKRLRAQWSAEVEAPAREAKLPPPRLVILPAQYRTMDQPLVRLIRQLEARAEGRTIAVLVPEIERRRWYEYLLHTWRPFRLRAHLQDAGIASLIIIQVPWRLESGR
jgi:amino acid transporter